MLKNLVIIRGDKATDLEACAVSQTLSTDLTLSPPFHLSILSLFSLLSPSFSLKSLLAAFMCGRARLLLKRNVIFNERTGVCVSVCACARVRDGQWWW